jgi:DNA-binding transcriptional MerR regulator
MQRDADDGSYKLDELAEKADVSPRTVRYYVQRGLLAPPVFRGKDTVYGEGHLARLRLIKKLQDERFMPLEAIAVELEGRSDDEVRAMLERVEHGAERRLTNAREPLLGHPTEDKGGPYRARMRPVHRASVERWVRVELADGVELHVRDDAGWDSAVLAERVREVMSRRR